MSLRTKTFIILLTTLSCSLILLYGVSRLILLRSFENLEVNQTRDGLKQVQSTLAKQTDLIASLCLSWSLREDAAAFVRQPRQRFIDTNLTPETFRDLHLSFIGFFDTKGEPVTVAMYDKTTASVAEPPAELYDFLAAHPEIVHHDSPDDHLRGLVLLPSGPLLFASHPIVASDRRGPVEGTIVFGRCFNEKEVARLAAELHMLLSITRLDGTQTARHVALIEAAEASRQGILIRPLDTNRIAAYTVIRDIFGQPALLLQAEMDRIVYRQGLQAITSFQWIVLGIGIFFGLVIILLLERQILAHVQRLTLAVSHIGSKGDLTARVPEEGPIELRQWSSAINQMLDSLAQSQSELRAIQQRLEERVRERTSELETAYMQLLHAEKLSCVGKMSASVAHEFGNPLFGIRNVLLHLRDKVQLDEHNRQLIDLGLRECKRMKTLINKLRDFHRPTNDVMTSVDVHKAIDDMVLLCKKGFANKQIAVDKNYAKDLPAVPAVMDQLKQVILNLLKNAEEALPETGGTISISTEACADKTIAIQIRDTGVGIQEEDMEKIFEPFFSTKQEQEGTGLGLSVSYMIIKKHGGEISVTSHPGEGTTFTVTLPTERPAMPEPEK